jgi:predicted Zn-dependent peptidase
LDVVLVVPGMRHPDRWALELLAGLLGGDGGAALWQDLVVGGDQRATSARAGLQLLEHHGVFWCSVRPRSSTVASGAEAAVWRTLARFREVPVPPAALATWKDALRRARQMERETPLGLARWLGEAAVMGNLDGALEDERRLDAVTPEDVLRFARRYLRRDNATLVLTVPRAAATEPAEDPEGATAASRELARLQPMSGHDGAAVIWAESGPWKAPVARLAKARGNAAEQDVAVRRHVLANGLTVLHERRPGAAVAGLSLQFRGGARMTRLKRPVLPPCLPNGFRRVRAGSIRCRWLPRGDAWAMRGRSRPSAKP